MRNFKMPLIDPNFPQLIEMQMNFQEEVKQMQVLSAFFISLNKELGRFNSTLYKSISTLKNSFEQSNNWGKIVKQVFKDYADTYSNLNRFVSSLKHTVIKPLDSFTSMYEAKGKQVIEQSLEVLKHLANKRKEIDNQKQIYFKGNDHIGTLKEEVSKKKMQILEGQKESYKQLVIEFNTSIDKHRTKYKESCKEWYENEKLKISFIKCSLHTFNNLFNDLSRNFTAICDTSKKALKTLDDTFATTLPNRIPRLFDRIILEFPEHIRNPSSKRNTKEVVQLFPEGVKEEDLKYKQEKIGKLLSNQSLTKEEEAKVFNLASTLEGIHVLCKEFFKVNYKLPLTNKDSFRAISRLSLIILDKLIELDSLEASYLSVLVYLGNHVLNDNGPNNRYYLREEYVNHPIWKYKATWNKLIDHKISKKKLSHRSGAENILLNSHMNGKTKGAILRKSEFDYFEFATIVREMGFYLVERRIFRELLLKYVQMYDINEERVLQLLTDYESIQQYSRIQISKPKYIDKLLRQKKRKYGNLKFCIKKGISLGLIEDIEMKKLLVVSKEWNRTFKNRIYKLLLKSKRDRLNLWQSLLCNKLITLHYKEAKDKLLKEPGDNHLNEIIKVDVLRSFYNYPTEYRDSIINILRVYACYNEEIKYCQGMNCIAGFLFILYKDESVIFHIMTSLIEKFNLSPLFKEGMPLLKSYLYQLNKLIAIYLPKIHAHLAEEKVSVDCFAPPWFLTIFTCVIQYTECIRVPPLLLKIFDGFLANGIRSLFKFILFILAYFEQKLLSLNSENLMQFFNEIIKNDLFFNNEIDYKLHSKKYNITSELLQWIEDEYKYLCDISKCVGDYSYIERSFTHYIQYKGKYTAVYIEN